MEPTAQALPPLEDTLLPLDTRRSLPIALLRARETVMHRFRPLLASHDLTEQQWRVIRVLGETITAAGVAMIGEVTPGAHAIYASIQERYGAHRIEQLLDLLDDLVKLKL